MLIAEWFFALAALGLFMSRGRRTPEGNMRLMRRLLWSVFAVVAALALFSTVLQYLTWKSDPLSANLLPSHQSILYFAKYAGTHFWLTPILSGILSAAFYGFLTLLEKKSEWFFEEGEVELGALAVFLAGWPRIVVFLPAVFLAVLMLSGIKMALQKGAYTTLGTPFLVGLIVTLACGFAILELLGLQFLAVIPGIR